MSERLKDIIAQNSSIAKEDVQDIHQFITDEVDNDAQLDFDSPSKTAEWRLWIEVKAFISFIMKGLWAEAKADLTAVRDSGISANRIYFAREWRKFQYGDQLLVDDSTARYYYEVEDDSKKIVKRLSIVQLINNWEIRVATEDGSGNPIPFTTDQLSAYRKFIDETSSPGAMIPIVSRNSDKLDARFTIYYNALNIKLEDLKGQVEAAYLQYIATIDIDGLSVYYIERHRDSLQAVSQVTDVEVNKAEAKIDGDEYNVVNRKYEPVSGYLEKDAGLDFDTLLSYVAE